MHELNDLRLRYSCNSEDLIKFVSVVRPSKENQHQTHDANACYHSTPTRVTAIKLVTSIARILSIGTYRRVLSYRSVK